METGNQISEMRIEDGSPEKAGVGGSIPSLATSFKNLQAHLSKFGCIWLHFRRTLLHRSCLFHRLRHERSQLPNRLALRLRNHLLVHILSRARPAMSHQPLGVFYVHLGLVHPSGTGASQDLPVYPPNAQLPPCRLDVSRQYDVVTDWSSRFD
jgi:hypothetical protein